MIGNPAKIFSNRWKFFLGAALLVAAVFAAYAPAFRASLIWDDDFHFASNPAMFGLRGLLEIWTSRAGFYYPLTLTTFWFLHKLFGFHPLPYHMGNIALHAVNAILLWRLLARLRIPGAGWAAALFALHPVQVESVAWVTELKNTQSAFFALCSLLFAERSGLFERDIPDARWFAAAAAAFLLSILSKTSTVVLPAIFALLLWWRGRFTLASARRLTPFVGLALIAAGWTIWEQRFNSGATGFEWSQGWAFRLALAGHTLWFYLFKLAWPHPLIFFYPKWIIHAASPPAYLPLAAIVGIPALLWATRRRWAHAIALGLFYFGVALFPVMGFFNVYFMRYAFVADHFQYLACIGPLALFAAAVEQLPTPARPLIHLPLIAALALLSWRHAHAFQSERALWMDTLQKNPAAWMVHNNLGASLQGEGDLEGAERHYEAAVRYNPDHYEALSNLANLLMARGDLDEAARRYERAIELRPDFTPAIVNLGLLQEKRGRPDLALVQYQHALSWNPKLWEAWVKIASLQEREGQMLEAVRAWKKALALRGASPMEMGEFFYRRAYELSANGQQSASSVYLGEVEKMRSSE